MLIILSRDSNSQLDIDAFARKIVDDWIKASGLLQYQRALRLESLKSIYGSLTSRV
jgi:hypothetical protein